MICRIKDSGLVGHDERDYALTKQGKRAIECLNILEYYFEDR